MRNGRYVEQRREKGVSFITILIALVLVGALYWVIMTPSSAKKASSGALLTARKTSQDAACQMNRLALEKMLVTWSATHPGETPTLEALKRDQVVFQPCPEGGQFELRGNKVFCTLHDPAP
jgi:hypothetical protein